MFEVREDLTTTNILSKINDENIFRFYCKSLKNIGEHFNSELRDDKNASCMISYYNDKLWYKDFGLANQKAVDCFGYVMLKYNVTFMQALGLINLDFNLGLQTYIEYPPSLNYLGLSDNLVLTVPGGTDGFARKGLKTIVPIYRDWLEIDVKYWKHRYYADQTRLKFFEIHPISAMIVNDKVVKVQMPTYNYLVDKEQGIDIVKIYSPFSKKYKWISNCKAYHYLGYNQLPWFGSNIIITKSLKDVVVLSLFGLPAIAPQSEAQVISQEMYEKLRKRFDNFYILYDNDRAGVDGAKQTVETFNKIKPIFIPIDSGVKDISDYIDRYRYKATEKLIKQLIC